MLSTYYIAAWTDSGCTIGCTHEHRSVISAAACISNAGGFVVAVEDRNLRELNEKEESDFQIAMYASHLVRGKMRARMPLRSLKPIWNWTTPIQR